MKSNVLSISRKRKYKPVTMRYCLGCGFYVSQLLVDRARFDFECDNCGKYKLSEFKPVKGN